MIKYEKNKYQLRDDDDKKTIQLIMEDILFYEFPVISCINTIYEKEKEQIIENIEQLNNKIVFTIKSNLWDKKEIEIILKDNGIEYYVRIWGNGQKIDTVNYFNDSKSFAKGTYNKIYAPRFDWKNGKIYANPNEKEILGCQQWLSPPPFCYGLMYDNQVVACGIGAKSGEYNFLSFDYNGTNEGAYFTLTYEGHTSVKDVFTSPALIIQLNFHEENEAVEGYVNYLRTEGFLPEINSKEIPKWWKKPIFCGWGQMRYDYRKDHDNQENGSFINVTRYATEPTYRYYMDIIDEKDINPGTIIIDMGWAEQPALGKPCKRRWINLRKFIDEQHEKGRKVLLWYTPVVTSGLPIEACMTLDGKPVAPDPSSIVYQEILKEQLHLMLGNEEGCADADGFKIDFTQNTPSENGVFRNYLTSFWGLIQEDKGDNNPYVYPQLNKRDHLIKTKGELWGVEVLRKYIELIYTGMKKIKEDSVLITHTANPYFADIVDILRLNDLDGDCDNVLNIMKNRFEISKICCTNWLIDTDNDLMYDKKKWREYIQLQPSLGIPDTYYISGIASSMEAFGEEEYTLIKKVWDEYQKSI